MLQNADVDDEECRALIGAMETNNSLTKLDLAHNLIGQAESKNTVEPDLVTGGEAFADMLPVNVKLVALDLSWNHLQKDSAIAFARALRENETLRDLSLAYNSFAEEPAAELGLTLCTNKALRTIDLSYNSVTPAACLVLANALRANADGALRHLNLDGNQPGRHGNRALMNALRCGSARPRGRHHDAQLRDDGRADALFDTGEPSGSYMLDMERPIDRDRGRARAAREHARRLRVRAARAPPALEREQGEDARD